MHTFSEQEKKIRNRKISISLGNVSVISTRKVNYFQEGSAIPTLFPPLLPWRQTWNSRKRPERTLFYFEDGGNPQTNSFSFLWAVAEGSRQRAVNRPSEQRKSDRFFPTLSLSLGSGFWRYFQTGLEIRFGTFKGGGEMSGKQGPTTTWRQNTLFCICLLSRNWNQCWRRWRDVTLSSGKPEETTSSVCRLATSWLPFHSEALIEMR